MTTEKKKQKKQKPSRILHFLIPAILQLISAVFLNLFYKHIPFFTDDFTNVLVYFNITSALTIFGYALLIFYHRYWLEGIVRLITGISSVISLYIAWIVFPFDFEFFFGLRNLNSLARVGLLVITIITGAGALIETIKILSKTTEEK